MTEKELIKLVGRYNPEGDPYLYVRSSKGRVEYFDHDPEICEWGADPGITQALAEMIVMAKRESPTS